MDDRALDALAPAVDHPHAQEAFLAAGPHVLLHHGGHVARREGVQVQLVRDGEDDGPGVLVLAQRATSADSASRTGASQRSTSRRSAPLRRR